MGFIFPDIGDVRLRQVRQKQIGYLPERMFFPPRSRVAEYLFTIGELSGLRGQRLRDVVANSLQRVGLSEAAQKRIQDCSKGMAQRLGLAQALLSNPPLLVLDEPMSGLDPTWQHQVRDIIRHEHQKGKTIVLSTHRLNDIAELCTHVGIFNQGRLVRAGALQDVLPMRQQVTIFASNIPAKVQKKLKRFDPAILIEENSLMLYGDSALRKDEVLRFLLKENVQIEQLEQQRTTLEEFYLETLYS